MRHWLRLAMASCAFSALIVATIAVVMIVKGELDAMYCSSFWAERFFPCIPTGTGIAAAVLLTIICAVPIFVLFSPVALIGSKRRDR